MASEQARSCQHAVGGFTLVELLVVISIISMIMAITLPALNSSREQGKRVTCLSNLRNLTQGWMMYAMENDDHLCSARTDWDVPPANHWVADGPYIPGNTVGGTARAIRSGVLWPYVGETTDVYRCRSDHRERLRSYAIARSMRGILVRSPTEPVYFRLSEIKAGSQKMVFVDAESLTPWIERPFPLPRIDGRTQTVTWLLKADCTITARHSDGCNVSFADGHCEYYKYRDPRTIAWAHVEPGDRGGFDNPDFIRIAEWGPQSQGVQTDPGVGEAR